ncbi:MAG: biotin--[acetyl-CoA-carboxylase] ligase [Clostridium fessum]
MPCTVRWQSRIISRWERDAAEEAGAAPHGVGIWMSLLLRPELPPTCASMLTLVAALAVADGIREVCDLEAKIKWPNDIVVNGKKVCGILTEMSTELECINYIVTGIGINVANHEFPEEIRDVATSLYLETGKKCAAASLSPRSCVRMRDIMINS